MWNCWSSRACNFRWLPFLIRSSVSSKAPSQLMIGLKTSKPLSNLLTQVR